MIKKLSRNDFDQIFEIMEMSFPQDEYRPYEKQKELFDDPAYQIYAWVDSKTDAIQGFLAIWEFEEVVFFEHLAVNPAYRNNGIGGKILREVVALSGKMVCLEVELPETEIAARRIGFYERNHFCLNEYAYEQPALSEGCSAVPLLIMTYGRPISEEEFGKIKNLLYRRVYKQV